MGYESDKPMTEDEANDVYLRTVDEMQYKELKQDKEIVCEFCGDHCYKGAEHNARVEANDRYNDPPKTSIMQTPTGTVKLHECFYCGDVFTYIDAVLAGTTAMYAETYCSAECEKQDLQNMEDQQVR